MGNGLYDDCTKIKYSQLEHKPGKHNDRKEMCQFFVYRVGILNKLIAAVAFICIFFSIIFANRCFSHALNSLHIFEFGSVRCTL